MKIFMASLFVLVALSCRENIDNKKLSENGNLSPDTLQQGIRYVPGEYLVFFKSNFAQRLADDTSMAPGNKASLRLQIEGDIREFGKRHIGDTSNIELTPFADVAVGFSAKLRSEEHTSEL